jgi:hypothetical protein
LPPASAARAVELPIPYPFTTTSYGTSDGVEGVGIDIVLHDDNIDFGSFPYDAFVTCGTGGTEQFDLGSGARFFGLTSSDRIKSILFAGSDQLMTVYGRFGIDNLTIGTLAPSSVPLPQTLPLVAAPLAAIGVLRRRREGSKNKA